MAPLPTENTGRVFIDYVTGSGSEAREHTTQIRHDGSLTNLDLCQLYFVGLLDAIGPSRFLPGWRVLGVRFANPGSTLSFPAALNAQLAGFLGTSGNTPPSGVQAIEYTWQGRGSTSGRRVDLSLYGLDFVLPNDFRWTPGEVGGVPVQQTVTILEDAGVDGIFLTVAGDVPLWKQYVNVNYNSYWEGELRR